MSVPLDLSVAEMFNLGDEYYSDPMRLRLLDTVFYAAHKHLADIYREKGVSFIREFYRYFVEEVNLPTYPSEEYVYDLNTQNSIEGLPFLTLEDFQPDYEPSYSKVVSFLNRYSNNEDEIIGITSMVMMGFGEFLPTGLENLIRYSHRRAG